MQTFAVVGAHTDVGKSAVSAALCFSFGFSYHKFVQAGTPTDSAYIASLSPHTRIIPSAITLATPTSPHRAKKLENLEYNALTLPLPQTKNVLIETAGGLYTPLDSDICVIDFITHHNLPVVLVGGYYLGGINHLLLSIEALKSRGITILALIMSEGSVELAQAHIKDTDSFITQYSGFKIAHLPTFKTQESFAHAAQNLAHELQAHNFL